MAKKVTSRIITKKVFPGTIISARNTALIYPKPSADGKSKDSIKNNKGGGMKSRSRKRGGSGYIQNSDIRLFEGANKYVQVFIALRTDILIKKIPFDVFQDELVE